MRSPLSCALLLVLAAPSFAADLSPERAEVLKNVATELRTKAYVPGIDLGRWDSIVAESADRLAQAKDDEEFARELNADLRKFGASHFRFMTPRQERTRVTQRTVGLGLSGAPGKDGLKVVAVAPDSPADKAGIKAGEIVDRIDGKPATAEAMRGEEGKTVRVLVRGRKEKTLKFAPYSLRRPATLTRIDAETALFRLPTFSNGYDRAEVEKCVQEAARYPSLIVDLRNNGGGAVVSMQHLMSLFMPQGSTVGTFVTKPLATAYAGSHKASGPDPVAIASWSRYAEPWKARQIHPANRAEGPLYRGNVVVLVNRGSASASEIFASAMHDVVGAGRRRHPLDGRRSGVRLPIRRRGLLAPVPDERLCDRPRPAPGGEPHRSGRRGRRSERRGRQGDLRPAPGATSEDPLRRVTEKANPAYRVVEK